jgi:hypothetical protein
MVAGHAPAGFIWVATIARQPGLAKSRGAARLLLGRICDHACPAPATPGPWAAATGATAATWKMARADGDLLLLFIGALAASTILLMSWASMSGIGARRT